MALLLVMTGCGESVGSGGGECTAIGVPVGVGLEIDAPLADQVSAAHMTVSWAGERRSVDVALHPSTTAQSTDCDGEVCSAEMLPTGGQNGFADVTDLPEGPVEVTVTLSGVDGDLLLEHSLELTPQLRYPNGPECGPGGPQAQLVVHGDGTVSART